ncbi:MAG: hypothetical protein WC443_13595 [Desulfobaccales bacterium]
MTVCKEKGKATYGELTQDEASDILTWLKKVNHLIVFNQVSLR